MASNIKGKILCSSAIWFNIKRSWYQEFSQEVVFCMCVCPYASDINAIIIIIIILIIIIIIIIIIINNNNNNNYNNNGVTMTPKRRLLTLIFACLCFKKSLSNNNKNNLTIKICDNVEKFKKFKTILVKSLKNDNVSTFA